MLLQRLFPDPAEVDAEDLHARLDLGSHAPPKRPYLVLNMVSSLDGRATRDGTTRELGAEVDQRLFHLLRTQADAIMAGAGTVRVERYGRPVRSDELTERRVAASLDPNPPLVVISDRLQLPPDLPVMQDPEARVLVVTGAEHELPGVRAQVVYIRTGDDLPAMLQVLREEHGIRSVLCEGGPTLNSFLLAAEAVDELFLCTSPQLVGGSDALTIVAANALAKPRAAELVWLLRGGGELFARWRITPS